MRIFVTGGTGYIGSHTVIELMTEGHDVIILDNLSNSDAEVVNRIERITKQKPRLVVGDIADYALVKDILEKESIEAVIHFAAKKAVGESMQIPDVYYRNNVGGMATLCQAMRETGVRKFVFSSSAAVYGEPEMVPVTEDASLHPISAYGATKKVGEELLTWVAQSAGWSVAVLRYFNPVGAHASGFIGESPRDANNLVPIVVQAVAGVRDAVTVYGTDYPTPDGTGVRDYIHVVDLAKAHIAALTSTVERAGLHTYNIGTGQGHSVLEVIASMEKMSGKKVPHVIGARRSGDVATLVASTTRATNELHWQPTLTLDDMTASAWTWWHNSHT